jgi:carboxyl-terminal processing protease
MIAEDNGDYEGIGVSVIQTVLNINGYEYQVFEVISIYENAPAQSSDLQIGDMIYAIKDGEEYKSIAAVGGYTKALTMIRGEAGTNAEFAAFRPTDGEEYEIVEFSITRGSYESQSVRYYTKENDPTLGVIHISGFDMTTPNQLKVAINALTASGAEHFVFDLRNNPGGDLESIKAVLSYFLKEGDLILRSIDRQGNTV